MANQDGVLKVGSPYDMAHYLLKSDEHGNYVAIKGYTSSVIKICIFHFIHKNMHFSFAKTKA